MEVAVSDSEVSPTPVLLTNGLQQGEYYIGPRVPSVSASPVKSIQEYLGKKVDSDEFVTMKILSLMSPNGDSSDDNQGKVLLHNEYSILSLLQDQPGVIHQHGLFREGSRIILVLDCVHPHNYDSRGLYQDFVNLQQYVIQEKKIQEREALELFLMLMNVVQAIHKKNIVHRDLKLGNVVINKSHRTQQVTIINFALGKHLVREDDLLTDQRGSLAYVSPDVLSGEPYAGKPSDIWSLGVLLYTMIYGQFPFYDNDPQELFKKIKIAKFSFPRDTQVSLETTLLIKQMIELDPSKRLTASSTRDAAQSILSRLTCNIVSEPVQIVPEVDMSNTTDSLVPDQETSNQTVNAFIAELSAPRLTINPFINSDQQYSRFFVQSPQSPIEAGQFIFPTEPFHRMIPSINPFLCASPTGRISITQSPSTSNFSSSQSLPASMYSSQRHSVHILQTSSSPDSAQEHSPSLDMHLHPYHVHHRHSFSEGDPNNAIHLRSLLTHPSPIPHSHGRRSLGSMLGTIQSNRPHRRNSHHSPSRGINPLLTEMPRIRRRSHEPRDNERDILQSLQAAVDRGVSQRPYSAEHTT